MELNDNDVKTRIMKAATHLFANKGYASTSVREIVEAAGVTKPTLYYWFDSKEGLFVELVESYLDGLNDLVQKWADAPGSVRERLAGFIRDYVNGGGSNREGVMLMIAAHAPADTKQPRIDLLTMHARRMHLFEGLLREGVERGELRADLDVPYAVRSLGGMLNAHTMACVQGFAAPNHVPEHLIDLFYRGVSG